jgi:hypothetical protein
LSQISNYLGEIAYYGSFVLALFTLDPNGNILKFSQTNQLISRFRFLFINFGIYLTIFLRAIGEIYDPETSKSETYVLNHSEGFRGKFSSEKPYFTVVDKETVTITIYIITWILKTQTYVILNMAKYSQKITRIQCRFVDITQKIHSVAFEEVVMEIFFYGFRTLGQTRDLSFMEIFTTVLLLLMIIFDIVEIWVLVNPKNVFEKK